MKFAACTTLLATSLFAALPSGSEAWSDDGHELAAQIANATISDASVRKHIEYELAVLDPVPSLAKAATWPDMIRSVQNVRAFDTFHFVNGMQSKWGGNLYQCSLDQQATTLSTATTMIANIGREETAFWYRSFCLRYLTHIIVDIHQPFHALSRCLDDEKSGDLGGNRGNKYFVAEGEDKGWSMHSIWDLKPWMDPELDVEAGAMRLMEKFRADGDFTTGYYNNITVDVAGFISSIKAVDMNADRKEVEAQIEPIIQMILDESQELAKEANDFAYPDETTGKAPWPFPDQVLPEDYLEYLRKVSDARIAAGGYRLAAILEATMTADQFNDAPKCNIDQGEATTILQVESEQITSSASSSISALLSLCPTIVLFTCVVF